MTDPLTIIEPVPSLAERLAAGRRAALASLVQNASVVSGTTPEAYTGSAALFVNGNMDIGPGIDAAVMETLVGSKSVALEPSVVEDGLVKELEWLLSEARAGRVRTAAWAFTVEGEQQKIGYSWHVPGGRQWGLTAALDRLMHFWRKSVYG